MSEAAGHDVTMEAAVEDYVRTVLPEHWDEQSYLSLGDTQEMAAIFDGEEGEDEEPLSDDEEFAARDEETAGQYQLNPMGFTAGMKFKGE